MAFVGRGGAKTGAPIIMKIEINMCLYPHKVRLFFARVNCVQTHFENSSGEVGGY